MSPTIVQMLSGKIEFATVLRTKDLPQLAKITAQTVMILAL
jgi:hypothetical protein